MDQISEIEDYLTRFVKSRIGSFKTFYADVMKYRRHQSGIYQLKKGTELMDLLHEINHAFESGLSGKLVPEQYASPKELFEYLVFLRKEIARFESVIQENYEHVKKIGIHSYETTELDKLFKEISIMLDYAIDIYDVSTETLPIHRLKRALVNRDVDSFIQITNGLLANISYLILKDKEGYLHSNIVLLLKLLGFDIIAEDSSNIGRIDAVIKFSRVIYIIEFKRSGKPSEALDQIKEKKYFEKFETDLKDIIMIGAVFDDKNKRIEKFIVEDHKTKLKKSK